MEHGDGHNDKYYQNLNSCLLKVVYFWSYPDISERTSRNRYPFRYKVQMFFR